MIEIKQITKRFDDFVAVDAMNLTMESGQVFGLLGTNGAGKSTLMRMIAGVVRPEQGQILIDEKDVYDNPSAKEEVFFISDDPYFFGQSTGQQMADYYAMIYPAFQMEKFHKLMEIFKLDENRKVTTFSKGMKKQLSIILGISAHTKYLLCDETFDGLDPAMRQAVKTLFAREIVERGLTPIIASHNLRELEDICDSIGLLHQGRILLAEDLDVIKCNVHKVQLVAGEGILDREVEERLKPEHIEKRGGLAIMTVRGSRETVERRLQSIPTVYAEILPLTLEEVFISETEEVGYDVKKLLLED